ncbi:MAG TPA: hypothetical protein DIW82_09470 [Corynebacterium nuruki]|uniref:Uncharacterized protein n=1 Tax=Corynebacterium nuruki TaxID=1032851 RepID=A0A3D4T0E1_9CORY|nr:hypothetical protein [Corynebacterium nuruki]
MQRHRAPRGRRRRPPRRPPRPHRDRAPPDAGDLSAHPLAPSPAYRGVRRPAFASARARSGSRSWA